MSGESPIEGKLGSLAGIVRRKGAGRPAAIRCGCFLPDLTRLANANARPTPGGAYGGALARMQESMNHAQAREAQSAKIVSVSLQLEPPWRCLMDLCGNSATRGIRQRFLARCECKLHLLAHVPGSGPAHQRIRPLCFGRRKFKEPLVGVRPAGLHGILGALKDSGGHDFIDCRESRLESSAL